MSDTITAPLTPLVLDRRGVCALLMMAPRTFDRLRACGKFPRPDIELSERLIRWKTETVRSWVDAQAGSK